ncbi:MAG TPA: beta-ketoacyl-ACP reductase [Candidatus Nanoarchaeia archaeon]|nr:beta-ketoacyl-ACP reductase [Candidatus Nanoarchaeia archaeon]
MRFKDKVVLITGSSKGLGKAIALEFAKEGANVIINYHSDKDGAQGVLDNIKSLGVQSDIIKADVSNPEEVNNMIKSVVKKFGKLDILINNSGIIKDARITSMSKESWDEVISVNLTGVYNCTKAVGQVMEKQKSGKIINISSIVAQTGSIGASNYAASKAGVIGFTKSVAKEFAKFNINVNAVALGYFNTGLIERLTKEIQGKLLGDIPFGRFGDPKEAANAVLFLASEDSSYITGQVINVNGGLYM